MPPPTRPPEIVPPPKRKQDRPPAGFGRNQKKTRADRASDSESDPGGKPGGPDPGDPGDPGEHGGGELGELTEEEKRFKNHLLQCNPESRKYSGLTFFAALCLCYPLACNENSLDKFVRGAMRFASQQTEVGKLRKHIFKLPAVEDENGNALKGGEPSFVTNAPATAKAWHAALAFARNNKYDSGCDPDDPRPRREDFEDKKVFEKKCKVWRKREQRRLARGGLPDPILIAEPWKRIGFYASRLRTADQPGGVESRGSLRSRTVDYDGSVYKFRGKTVIYVHAHGISYTLAEIEKGALTYTRFKKIEMKDKRDNNRLLLLDPVSGKTLVKPDGPLHPLHIFLADTHEYDENGNRRDERKPFKFVLGDATKLKYFPDCYPEYAVARREAVAHAETLLGGRRCNKCPETDSDKFGSEFEGNRYILRHTCIECDKARCSANNAAEVKTVDGKAWRMAGSAISRQKRRRSRNLIPDLIIPLLRHKTMRPPLAAMLESLLGGFLTLSHSKTLNLQPYNATLDKLVDSAKVYVGRSSGAGGVNLSNNSITVNINNWMSNATDGEGKALLDSYDTGRDASRDAPKAGWMAMLDTVGKQFERIDAGKQPIYESEYHRKAARGIGQLVDHMILGQNRRRKIKGREHLPKLTDAHRPYLRSLILELLKEQGFRCAYSLVLLCPARMHGFQMSVERINNYHGYQKGNVCLVLHLLQAELNSTQRIDKDGNKMFKNLKWSKDRFFESGRAVFSDKLRFRFTDLPLNEQREHEAAICAALDASADDEDDEDDEDEGGEESDGEWESGDGWESDGDDE